jgi:hypothetical protein
VGPTLPPPAGALSCRGDGRDGGSAASACASVNLVPIDSGHIDGTPHPHQYMACHFLDGVIHALMPVCPSIPMGRGHTWHGCGQVPRIPPGSPGRDRAVHGHCQTNAPTNGPTPDDPHPWVDHAWDRQCMDGPAPINATGGGPSHHGCTATASIDCGPQWGVPSTTNALPPLLLQS